MNQKMFKYNNAEIYNFVVGVLWAIKMLMLWMVYKHSLTLFLNCYFKFQICLTTITSKNIYFLGISHKI